MQPRGVTLDRLVEDLAIAPLRHVWNERRLWNSSGTGA
jgi:hypothetical protein